MGEKLETEEMGGKTKEGVSRKWIVLVELSDTDKVERRPAEAMMRSWSAWSLDVEMYGRGCVGLS